MRKLRRHIAAAIIIAILAPSFTYAVQPGGTPPAFSLIDQKGTQVTLDAVKDKVVFLTFWATWCPSCKEELPDLDVLHKKYAGSGFTVLSICVEPSESALARFLEKNPLSYPVMIDKNGDVAAAYRFSALPASYIIGRDGIVHHIHVGYGKEFLELYDKEITEMLQNK